jgi:putative oxidoreductase
MAGGKGNDAADIGKLILRLAAGAGMMTHGWPKVFGVDAEGARRMIGFTKATAELGFPHPEWFAWAAALSELVGGALLILGLGTRVASFFIACTMTVAIWSNRSDGFHSMELALLYLAPALLFLLSGPGKKSLDALFFPRK